MIAPPFVTWRTTRGCEGFSWSRFGPTVPVAPAAFSVWQLAHSAAKIFFPSVPSAAGDCASAPFCPAPDAT